MCLFTSCFYLFPSWFQCYYLFIETVVFLSSIPIDAFNRRMAAHLVRRSRKVFLFEETKSHWHISSLFTSKFTILIVKRLGELELVWSWSTHSAEITYRCVKIILVFVWFFCCWNPSTLKSMEVQSFIDWLSLRHINAHNNNTLCVLFLR